MAIEFSFAESKESVGFLCKEGLSRAHHVCGARETGAAVLQRQDNIHALSLVETSGIRVGVAHAGCTWACNVPWLPAWDIKEKVRNKDLTLRITTCTYQHLPIPDQCMALARCGPKQAAEKEPT